MNKFVRTCTDQGYRKKKREFQKQKKKEKKIPTKARKFIYERRKIELLKINCKTNQVPKQQPQQIMILPTQICMQEKTVERREIKILKANEKCLVAKIQITWQSPKKNSPKKEKKFNAENA